jgi:hypothetical protein
MLRPERGRCFIGNIPGDLCNHAGAAEEQDGDTKPDEEPP